MRTLDPHDYRCLLGVAVRRAADRAREFVGPKAADAAIRKLVPFFAPDALLRQLRTATDAASRDEVEALLDALGVGDETSDAERWKRLEPAVLELVDAAAETFSIVPMASKAEPATNGKPQPAAATNGAAATAEPFFVPIRELVEDEANEVEWLVPGILPKRALALLFGPPKGGKTELLFAMLAALERGAPFLGRPTVETACVYASEENVVTLRQKAQRYGLERMRVAPVTKIGQLDRSAPLHDLAERAVAHAREVGAEVVVIDTVGTWSMLNPEAENDSGVMTGLLQMLHEKAADGLTIVVVHHMRKTIDGADPTHAARGSSAITAIPDVLISLVRPSGQRAAASATVRELSIISRYAYEQPPVLAVDRLPSGTYAIAASVEEAKSADERRRVLNALEAASEPLTRKEIKSAAGIRDETLSSILKAITDGGEIKRSGAGKPGSPWRYERAGKSSPESRETRPLPSSPSPSSPPVGEGDEETTRFPPSGDSGRRLVEDLFGGRPSSERELGS